MNNSNNVFCMLPNLHVAKFIGMNDLSVAYIYLINNEINDKQNKTYGKYGKLRQFVVTQPTSING